MPDPWKLGWPMAEVRFLTDEPSSGNRPALLESRKFSALAHQLMLSVSPSPSTQPQPGTRIKRPRWPFALSIAGSDNTLFTPASPHRIAAFFRAQTKRQSRWFLGLRESRSRCVQESHGERLGFRPVRPARIVPESPNSSSAARLWPLAQLCPILGALSAKLSVP